MRMNIVVHETPDELAYAVAAEISGQIAASDGRFTLGLAGGSSPEPTYRRLREADVPWEQVDAWLSDERWVPPDHPRSNGRMASETLLAHVGARFHRPPWGEMFRPDDSAAHYEAKIRSIHPDGAPDLIILGLGDDGHTASLFPGTKAMAEKNRWIVANHVPEHDESRLTATYPLLWRARAIVFVVTGEGKAGAVKKSLQGETPAGRVDQGDGRVKWHLDDAAASQLS